MSNYDYAEIDCLQNCGKVGERLGKRDIRRDDGDRIFAVFFRWFSAISRSLRYYITDCVTRLILGGRRSAGSKSATVLTIHQSVLPVSPMPVCYFNGDENSP